MKYIRTKYDGVYEVKDNKVIIGIISIDLETYIQNYGGIVANTPEELCDEFIYDFNNLTKVEHRKCYKDKDGRWRDYENSVLLILWEVETIKGAIWTAKGLIYVAKMNDKGEMVRYEI